MVGLLFVVLLGMLVGFIVCVELLVGWLLIAWLLAGLVCCFIWLLFVGLGFCVCYLIVFGLDELIVDAFEGGGFIDIIN